ncbi:AmmeMemoRadiSam system protein B [Aquisalimonas sp.]|uniref:AmmeMemoRadiSam system protein B n=1 Tax=Aquisalimonas sp. TaxID=1872621 RepID=UPI0025C225E6|nr:AmmeMemoRadiSam system protein B [Aquisalimonas sp.]
MVDRTRVRPPAVAGQFYPADRESLRAQVDTLLAEAQAPEGAQVGDVPKAVIAPHAGFVYSGAVAATAYRRLEPGRGRIRRVVVLGPSHFVYVRGLAAPTVHWFDTPLGRIRVDSDGIATALEQPRVITDDRPHAREHSLETQLPFIQRVLGDVDVVPLVVGEATPEEVGRVLAALWGGQETAIAISSDLSHFHDDATARKLDHATATAIETLRGEALGPYDACGYLPIAGLLWNAARRHARVRTLELRNSGDAGAPRISVVGYGAFELTEAAA